MGLGKNRDGSYRLNEMSPVRYIDGAARVNFESFEWRSLISCMYTTKP